MNRVELAEIFLTKVERALRDGCIEIAADWVTQIGRILEEEANPIFRKEIYVMMREWAEAELSGIIFLCQAMNVYPAQFLFLNYTEGADAENEDSDCTNADCDNP